MTRLRILAVRVLALFGRRRLDATFDDEVGAHLQLLTAEHIRRGLSQDEARAAARRDFGSVQHITELYRDQRGLPWLDDLGRDARFAVRALLRTPGFTVVAVVTLALGIGATTAIFSVVNAVLFQALPYPQAEQLTSITAIPTGRPAATEYVSYPTFLDWRSHNRSFESMAAYVVAGSTLTGRGDPILLDGAAVTTDLFQLLRAAPILGRTLLPEDGAAGAPRVVVISEELWGSRFAQNPQIVGESLALDGMAHIVVGVMPQRFKFPHVNPVPRFWMPLTQYQPFQQLLTIRAAPFLTVVGRLASGYGLPAAQSEMAGVATRLAQQYPSADRGEVVQVLPFKQKLVGDHQLALLMLFGAVGFLLLIACTNVANLYLARASGRTREMAIRVALGSGRGRLVQQLFVESLLLAFAGGVLGILVADGGIYALGALIREDLPHVRDIGIDRFVLGFSLVLSCLTGVLFGLAPAFVSARVDVQEKLKDGGHNATQGRRASRVQSVLVVSQVALTVVMLAGAALLVQTLVRLQQVETGFSSTRVLAATISLPQSEYPTPEQWIAVTEELLGRVEQMPGVDTAAYGVGVPFTAPPVNLPFELENQTPAEVGARTLADVIPISPSYFGALQIPVLRGRVFASSDTGDSPRVGIVNQTFARRFFGDENPIGKSILIGQPQRRRVEIVGLVGDTLQTSLTASPPALFYMPFRRFPFWMTTFVVRTRIDPEGVIGAFRKEVSAIAPGAPILDLGPLDGFVDRTVASSGRRALLLSTLSGLGLLLAAVGIYGILAYTVAGRTHEIGVRMALGANPRAILWLVLGQGLRLTLGGIALGLLISLAVTRLLANLLFQVSATDPITLTGAAILVLVITLVACCVPARRAIRVDPIVAFRYE